MLSASVHFQLLDHCIAQWALRQHAFDSFFQGTAREALLHFQEVGFVDTARVARVGVDLLHLGLARAEDDLVGVDHDHVVAHVHVGGEGRLVLAAEDAGDLGGHATEGLALSVEDKPIPLDRFGLRGDSAVGGHERSPRGVVGVFRVKSTAAEHA